MRSGIWFRVSTFVVVWSSKRQANLRGRIAIFSSGRGRPPNPQPRTAALRSADVPACEFRRRLGASSNLRCSLRQFAPPSRLLFLESLDKQLSSVNVVGSRYVEKRGYLSRYSHERMVQAREARAEPIHEFGSEAAWTRSLRQELPRFIPFLKKCGLDFHGRILEIGAGAGWLSAELSKLPRVVEVFATDFSTKVLQEHAPRVFSLLNAHASKIIRTPGDFHKLDFPSNYFDFVVSSAALQHATNPVQVLREVKRVLKRGGRFVAIREPVWPLVRLRARGKRKVIPGPGGLDLRHRTLSHYCEFFRQAGLPLEVKRVNLAKGLRYYFGQMVNGLTHARYAFIGTKKGSGEQGWYCVIRPPVQSRAGSHSR